ncbi:uncharacterized protein LOC108165186 [Drosophila miranda]|uniref:uncharacterized protein LOC108165186 n=1 Tax=Drosophila miranda TaxID=7229 RepID=UPI0007E86866|nr:uncharacterized protein LOC108165186 [Drosophila miranda]
MILHILSRGTLRHFSVGPLRWSKASFQKDPQTSVVLKTVAKKEPSALVVSVKAEAVCEVTKDQSQKSKKSNILNDVMKKKHNDYSKDYNEQKPGPTTISGYGQMGLPQLGKSVPWPVYRGPLLKELLEKDSTPVDVVPTNEKRKMTRRDYLRLMYKEERLKNPKEKKPVADSKMDYMEVDKKPLNPARVEFVNLKWKERQHEVGKRVQEADTKNNDSRFKMTTGLKGKID